MSRIKYATDAIMSFSYKPMRLSLVIRYVELLLAVPAHGYGA